MNRCYADPLAVVQEPLGNFRTTGIVCLYLKSCIPESWFFSSGHCFFSGRNILSVIQVTSVVSADWRFAQLYKQYICKMTEPNTIDEQWAVRLDR